MSACALRRRFSWNSQLPVSCFWTTTEATRKKKKMFSSSSCWASFQLTPRALLLALGMEHTCTLVRWKQLSGEIAGVTHCSSPHSSFAYFRPAPLIVTGEKVQTLSCPRLNAARCERPRGKLISGNVLAGGARYTCGTGWAETGIGVNKLIKSITAPDKAEGLAWEKPFSLRGGCSSVKETARLFLPTFTQISVLSTSHIVTCLLLLCLKDFQRYILS